MSGKIAILGAGGFVGSRLIEMAALAGDDTMVPVLRYPRGLARLSRLGLAWRQGDAGDVNSLRRAIGGCETVVNLTMGGEKSILADTKAIHAACRAEGVRRLIHMSSAAVYGCVARPDLPDDTPPDLSLWMEYAREKGRAENFLREVMASDGPEVVVLRPGQIWGPGAIWLSGPAAAIQRGSAFLLNGGHGVCNLIHVDNLGWDIRAVASHAGDIRGFYHVADDEELTWSDYYRALAAEIGADFASIHQVQIAEWNDGWLGKLATLKDLEMAKKIKRRMSKESKMRIKRLLREALARLRPPPTADRPGPEVSKVMWWNQSTRYRLPTGKFLRTFGRSGRSTFAESMARGGEWLRFAGFGSDPYSLAGGEPVTHSRLP